MTVGFDCFNGGVPDASYLNTKSFSNWVWADALSMANIQMSYMEDKDLTRKQIFIIEGTEKKSCNYRIWKIL